MPQFTVNLERKVKKRSSNEVIKSQFEYIVGRATSSNRKAWFNKSYKLENPVLEKDLWVYKVSFIFERKKAVAEKQLNKEANEVVTYLKAAAESKSPPWTIVGNPVADWGSMESTEPDVESDIVDFDRALKISEIVIPDVLINGSDEEIENHPAFQGIYGRAQHIRIIASSIQRMKDTNGAKRNHVLLYGLPGCAKSHIIKGWSTVLGKGGFLTINANSASRAGIERIFLDRFKETGTPPIIFVEEIEKSNETILTAWLSILDDRAEVRKVTHFKQEKADAQILSIATANDKILFDRLHGGRPHHPGALSSRFTKKLYIPRPDTEIMKRILLRDIELYGGNPAWVEPCIDIANAIKTNDPRIILSLLDGQDRLLDGSYKNDIFSIFQMEKQEDSEDLWGEEE